MKLQIITPKKNLDEFKSSNVASNRLRMAYLYEAVKSLGFDIVGGKTIQDADLYVVSKLTKEFDDIEAKKIITELNNKRVIVDYTDDYLHISSSKSSYYRELTKSSIFVTPVEELTQKLNLIGVPAHTISDGIDDYGVTEPNVHKHDRPELLWFGHNSNIPSLVRALDGYLNQYIFNLHVVTDKTGHQKLCNAKFRSLPKCKITTYPFSIDMVSKIAKTCDVCIIPTDKTYASANRLITALNLGLPVLADKIPSYSRFGEYFLKFSVANVKKILFHPENYHKLVLSGQEAVREEFSKDKLIGLWKELLIKNIP